MATTRHYLNSFKQAWVELDENGKKIKVKFTTTSGKEISRTALRFEDRGSYIVTFFNYKGKLRKEINHNLTLED